jgi:LacI family transcriptional regulator
MAIRNNITIKILAKKLGLSVGSVSKALNNSSEISLETRKKVKELAKLHNYKPNHFASNLRNNTSKTIAVVIPEISDSFFALAINGIEKAAQEKGYQIIISITNELLVKEKTIINKLHNGIVDGILISISRETDDSTHLKEINEFGIPIVFFDRDIEDMDTAKVVTNDFESGYNAVKHLTNEQCKNICFLSVSESLSISKKRLEGFKKGLNEFIKHPIHNNIVKCSTDATENHLIIKNLLMDVQNRPDGIVVSGENLTISIYNVCKELGIKIPDQMKIICFSNLAYATCLAPALSTITQPAFEIGYKAATLLCDTLEGKLVNLKEKIICPSVLEIRDSSISKRDI